MAGSEPGSGRIGVVAALDGELDAIRKLVAFGSWERRGELIIRCGRLRGRPVALAATGDGSEAAAAGLAALLEDRELVALLAVGIAGGLSPALAVGDVVVAERVIDGADPGSELRAPAWPGRGRGLDSRARVGVAVSVPRIVCTAAEKEELWSRGGAPEAAVVDLESAAWARLAHARGLPWRVLRAVSDAADEDLPLDFNRFRDARGRLRRYAVACHAARHPTLLPALRRLRSRLRDGARRLAEVASEMVAE